MHNMDFIPQRTGSLEPSPSHWFECFLLPDLIVFLFFGFPLGRDPSHLLCGGWWMVVVRTSKWQWRILTYYIFFFIYRIFLIVFWRMTYLFQIWTFASQFLAPGSHLYDSESQFLTTVSQLWASQSRLGPYVSQSILVFWVSFFWLWQLILGL